MASPNSQPPFYTESSSGLHSPPNYGGLRATLEPEESPFNYLTSKQASPSSRKLELEEDDESLTTVTKLAFGSRVHIDVSEAEDETFNAAEVVANLSEAPSERRRPFNISVPQSKVTAFMKALNSHLQEKSRQVVERAGRVSFWRGNEPFLRPALSRSLSLP